MRTLGRIILFFLIIGFGFKFAIDLLALAASLDAPDEVPEMIGRACVPLIFMILCIAGFVRLGKR